MKTLTILLILSFSLVYYISCSNHLPNDMYSRLDPRWKDFMLFTNHTIGYRPDIIVDGNAVGSLYTLVAEVLNFYNITIEGDIATPINLNNLIQKYYLTDPLKIIALLKISSQRVYQTSDEIEWDFIYDLMNTNSSIYFITQPEVNNTAGMVYEVNFEEEKFKYYDDLGNLGVANFSDVVYMQTQTYNLSWHFNETLNFLA
jgi:hypothetical protein